MSTEPRSLKRLVRRMGLRPAYMVADYADALRTAKWNKYLKECKANGGTIYDKESNRLKARAAHAHELACRLFAMTQPNLSREPRGSEPSTPSSND